MKQVKDMIKKNKYEKQNSNASNTEHGNDVCTWSIKNCKEHLGNNNGPKTGNNEDFQNRCIFWMNLITVGKFNLLNVQLHELEEQPTMLQTEVIVHNRCNILKQTHDVLVDVRYDKEKLLMDSANVAIE